MFRPRVGELLWNTTRLVLGTVVVLRRPRRRRGLAGRALVGAGPADLARAAGRAAGRAGVREQLRLDLAAARPGHLRRRAAGGHRCPTSRSSTCPSRRPSAGWTRRSRRPPAAWACPAGRCSCRVQLPQLRVALLGGSLLVALHLLAEFGALQMLRYPTFTTAIYDQYRATFNGPGATMLAGVLVLLCLVLLLAELRLRGRRGYARTGRGAARPGPAGALGAAHRARAGRARRPRRPGPGRAAGEPRLLDGGAAASTGARLGRRWPPPPGRRSASRPPRRRSPPRWRCPRAGWPCAPGAGSPRCSSAAPTSAARCPGIVVALALVTLSIRATPWLYQTVPVLLAAYAILFLPRAIVTVRAAVEQSPPALRRRRRLARLLGARPAAPGHPAAAGARASAPARRWCSSPSSPS